MKIVQAACWYYPDTVGGIEVYVAALSKHLRLAGHEVFIAAPHTQHKRERSYEHEGLPVYRYPIPLKPTRKESRGIIATHGTGYFHEWLAKLRPDVVHFQDLNIGLGITEMQFAKSLGVKVVFTSHIGTLGNLCRRGTLMYMGRRVCDGLVSGGKCAPCLLELRHVPEALARITGKIPSSFGRYLSYLPFGIGTALGMNYLVGADRSAFSRLFSLVDKFVVLTQSGADIVAANGFDRRKIFVNRLGIAESAETKKPSSQETPAKKPVKFGYLGRFEAIKGVYHLAKAAASLPGDVSFTLEFCGPVITPAEKNCLNKIKSIVRNDPRITFVAAISHAKTFDLLRSCDVLCCPSVCFEGGPTVALEAYAVGTPVIGTKIGGLAEIVVDKVNGRLVEPGDLQGLIRVMKEIAQDPSGTIEVWRKNIPSVRTMAQVAEDYTTIYKI